MMYRSEGLLCDATSLVENVLDMMGCVGEAGSVGRNKEWKNAMS
jgi:hypothetical protein